jgi:hypothetical protein
LLAHGRWFSLGTPSSSTTKTGCHEIAEILLKVALNTKNQIIKSPLPLALQHACTLTRTILIYYSWGHHDREIVGFMPTCAICLSTLKLGVRIPIMARCTWSNNMWYKICQWLAAGLWFSLCTPASFTNKTDRHDITEILLKVALNPPFNILIHPCLCFVGDVLSSLCT